MVPKEIFRIIHCLDLFIIKLLFALFIFLLLAHICHFVYHFSLVCVNAFTIRDRLTLLAALPSPAGVCLPTQRLLRTYRL